MAQGTGKWHTKLGATSAAAIIVLVAVVLILVNVLGNYFFLRADLTSDNIYSITDASKDTVRELKDPVTIKVFINDDIPQLRFLRSFIEDIVTEYKAYGGNNLDVKFVDPASDLAIKQEALDHGINPAQLQVRTSEGVSLRNVYSGIVVYQGEKSEAITQILNTKLEYDLTSAIRKVTRQKSVQIGFVSGHGQRSRSGDYGAISEEAKRLYETRDLDLSSEENVPAGYDALVIAGPRDNFSDKELFLLDQYLLGGGKLIILVDGAVDGPDGHPVVVESNIRDLLLHYGLRTRADLIVDPQQNFAQMLNIFISKPVPWIVKLIPGLDHPIVKNLGQFYLPFASSMDHIAEPPEGVEYTDLAFTSAKSWAERNKDTIKSGQLALTSDTPSGPFLVAATLQGAFPSYFADKSTPIKDMQMIKKAKGDARLLVVSSSQFLTNDNVTTQPGNAQFFLNSIDWLAADSALIQIRSKAVAERKIAELSLGKQRVVQAIDFLLAPLIVIIIGLVTWWRRRRCKVTLANI